MITFVISLVVLLLGYLLYSKLVERLFGADSKRSTPAQIHTDGVDYIALPAWRIFLIQFLNIAGLGPIFGAIMGVFFGPSAFLWIVFGTIFGGAVHDYLSGMISLRKDGANLPRIIGDELGGTVKQILNLISIVMLILVGVTFLTGPANILHNLVNQVSVTWWVLIIFAYYILATLLPIDKIIGRFYPIFGGVLLFMGIGIMIALFVNKAPIPELTHGLHSVHPKGYPVFPMMFVSIACGAISGFHATQSPLMARCMTNERQGRNIFYGAMVAEGVLALIWAAAASSFFGGVEGLHAFAAEHAGENVAALVVDMITRTWLGRIGGILAVLGVVFAPITSGDTALRSARLIIAELFHFDQKPIVKRLVITLPMIAVVFVLTKVNFDVIWRYFAWTNQTLSVFTLWAITVYMCKHATHKCGFMLTLLPALFMTAVCSCYIMVSPEGFGLSLPVGYTAAAVVCVVCFTLFVRKHKRIKTDSLR